jgi:hypothetical protein
LASEKAGYGRIERQIAGTGAARKEGQITECATTISSTARQVRKFVSFPYDPARRDALFRQFLQWRERQPSTP